ncbi:tetratricopeptide repeat protein [Planctomycetales bacterium ZRK34]|nr:tetratricopeptide repeat protein [Planctomycetales bacterium ZRK34]
MAWQTLLLAANRTEIDIYEVLVTAVLTVLLIAAVIKCVKIARAPKANTLGASSLALVISSMLISGAITNVMLIAPDQWLFVLGLAVLAVALLLIGLIAAVIARVQIARTPTKYERGGRLAWTSIVTVLIAGGIAVTVVVSNISDKKDQQGQSAVVAHVATHDNKPMDKQILPGLSQALEDDTSESKSTVAQSSSNACNFRIRELDEPWVKIDIQKLIPTASAGYIRQNPLMYLAVTEEQIGLNFFMDTDALAKITESQMRSESTMLAWHPLGPKNIDNIPGKLYACDLSANGFSVSYLFWIAQHNGYAYKIVAWCPQNNGHMLSQTGIQAMEHFELIDREAVASTPQVPSLTQARSSKYGYTIALSDEGWRLWPSHHRDVGSATTATIYRNYGYLAISPFRFDGYEPSTDALINAALSLYNFGLKQSGVSNRRSFQIEGGHGVAFTARRIREDIAVDFQLRVIYTDRIAYLIGGWTENGHEDLMPQIEAAMDRFRLIEPDKTFDHDALNPHELTTHGKAYNEIGLYEYKQGRLQTAAEWFARSWRINPTDSVTLGNAVDTWTELQDYTKALELLKHPARPHELPLKIRLLEAQLLYETGKTNESIRQYAKLFQEGVRNEAHMLHFANIMQQQGRISEALGYIARYLEGGESTELRLAQARLLASLGNRNRPISLLEQLLEREPAHVEATYELIRIYRDADRLKDALQRINRFIEHGNKTAEAFYVKGDLEFDLKRYREAKASFEQALAKAPRDESIQSAIDFVSGMLGEGQNTSIKQPIEPVALPSELLEQLAAVAPPEHDEPAQYNWYGHAEQFEPGQSHHTTYYMSVTVHNATGVSSFNTIEHAFDPLYESIYVNWLDVFNERGERVASGDPNSYYVVDQTAGQMATHDQVLTLPVPGLKPGYRIELAVTRSDSVPPRAYPFRRRFLITGLPVGRAFWLVRAPQDQLRMQSSHGVKKVAFGEAGCWLIDQPQVFHWEASQADLASFIPNICIADAEATWADQATEYLAEIEHRLPLPSQIKALAMQLTEGLATPEQRLAVVSQHVQKTLTYQAIEFGRRAHVMNPSPQITHDRYGDCKDHSLLLYHMLRANDIEAHLALIKTNGRLAEDLPSVDQFNHMIVFVPNSGEGLFIDCTDKYTDLTQGTPDTLAGQRALVLDADNPRLVTVPPYSDNAYRIDTERQLHISAEGHVSVQEQIEFYGLLAGHLRNYMQDASEKGNRELIQNTLASIDSKVRLQSLKIYNRDELNKPLRMELTYQLNDWFDRINQQLSGSLPCFWERYFTQADYIEQRVTPFELEYPLKIKSRATVHWSDNATPSAAPVSPIERSEKFGRWHVVSKYTNREMNLEFELHRPVGRYEADGYDAYHETWERAYHDFAPSLVLRLTAPGE